MTYISSHSSKRKFLNLRVGWGFKRGCIGAKNPNISKHQVGLTSTIVLWEWHIFFKMKIGHKEIDNFFVSRWSTLHPPKIVVANIEIMHLVFFCTCGRHILDYFCSFQNYCISFILKLVFKKNNSTNIYELEHMKYFCVKINMLENMKICKCT
jgi:hypothetical protein